MQINLTGNGDDAIAEIISDNIVLSTAQDAVEIVANCHYQGASQVVLREEQIAPDFFDLKTGLAGDVLQKFSNYRARLAIVGDFSGYTSKSLRDFIYESNKAGRINFVPSVEAAKEAFAKK